MACTVCGSNIPCGCSSCSQPALTNPLCTPTPLPGCCQNVVRAAPAPFYECAPSCAESHGKSITIQSFSADVKLIDTWNIPACGESATINSESLRAIVVGSYLWNPDFGYFEVTAFNSGTGQVTLTNHCTTGNAAAGTNVPSCTEFTVTVPPCDCNTATGICVAIDFTAPANGDCIDITLTSTTGLTASDTIQIGTGFYFVEAIKPNDIITICNHGEGITPGTSVIAGTPPNYNYCISIVSTNACDRTPEIQVKVLGCGADGVTVPLDGHNTGWVVTQLDGTSLEAAYRPLGGNDSTCTTLSANFVTTVGVTSYTNVLVASSAHFAVGDVLEIEGGGSNRFVVTNIPNATHVDLDVNPSPGDVTFPSGNLVCLASCCETVQAEIEALPFGGAADTLFNDTPFTVGPVDNDSHTTAPLSFSITNPSATKFMKVHLIMKFLVSGLSGAALGDLSSTRFGLNLDVNGGGPVEYAHVATTIATESDGGVTLTNDVEVVADYFISLATSATYAITGAVQKLSTGGAGAGENDGEYTATSTLLSYNWIGVPGADI